MFCLYPVCGFTFVFYIYCVWFVNLQYYNYSCQMNKLLESSMTIKSYEIKIFKIEKLQYSIIATYNSGHSTCWSRSVKTNRLLDTSSKSLSLTSCVCWVLPCARRTQVGFRTHLCVYISLLSGVSCVLSQLGPAFWWCSLSRPPKLEQHSPSPQTDAT